MGVLMQVRQQRPYSAQEGTLAGFWFCSKENGSGTHKAKLIRITTKAADYQNNSSVEDSQDERAKECQKQLYKDIDSSE